MDFDRFLVWRRQYAIVEMSQSPVRPVTCFSVYEALVKDGIAKKDRMGLYSLVSEAPVAGAKRSARLIMNELVKDNQRLIRKLVSQLAKRSTAFLEEEDLFQAGCMGFMRTLERFDPDRFSDKKRGASFATYLRHWVRAFLQASIADQQTIKQPRGYGMPYQVHKRIEEFEQRNGRAAEASDLGTIPKRGPKKKRVDIPVTQEMLDGWRAAAKSIVSLDRPVAFRPGDEGFDDTIGTGPDYARQELPDSSKSPEQLMTRAVLAEKAEKVVQALGPSSRQLIEEMREGVTVTTVAKRLGVSDEYVRRLRREAIEKVKRMMAREV